MKQFAFYGGFKGFGKGKARIRLLKPLTTLLVSRTAGAFQGQGPTCRSFPQGLVVNFLQ